MKQLFKRTIVIASVLLFCSCNTSQKKINSDDILIPDNIKLESPKVLTPKESEYDLNLLIYAFENGYGGRKFIPRDQSENALNRLNAVAQQPPISPNELCKKIDEVFLKITDFHLSARLNDNRCNPSGEARFRKASVGKNVHTDKKKPWSITHIKIKGNRIPIISITALPNHEDKVWNGFLDGILKEKRTAKAVLIDLRGNGGGDDTTVKQMASYFYGQDFISPVLSQIKSQTPETFALLANNYKLRIYRLQNENEPVPDFWYRRLSETMEKYKEAKAKKIPPEFESFIDQGKEFNSQKGYAKPIYILVDAECESSCESAVEAFEMHPHAVTVGENTGGFVHFGNMGFIILPYSKIKIQMATDFWKFKDGRFVEGTGYTPTIRVPAGSDALEIAKKELMKLF